ncbi:hypothetical protein CRUP_015246 [Coryphaenoides rupestris]|nr:hypothetical protein CRUP_015246 [Coryphaenoides rupestris]
MAEYMNLVRRALGQVRGHGGVRGLLVQFFRANDIKVGALVGVDKYGNRYFEDSKHYFFGKLTFSLDFQCLNTEVSNDMYVYVMTRKSLCPTRHRWLHCMTDDPPTTHPPEPRKFLTDRHQINVSGSSQQYVPFSTTTKKIHEWVPPKAQ